MIPPASRYPAVRSVVAGVVEFGDGARYVVQLPYGYKGVASRLHLRHEHGQGVHRSLPARSAVVHEDDSAVARSQVQGVLEVQHKVRDKTGVTLVGVVFCVHIRVMERQSVFAVESVQSSAPSKEGGAEGEWPVTGGVEDFLRSSPNLVSRRRRRHIVGVFPRVVLYVMSLANHPLQNGAGVTGGVCVGNLEAVDVEGDISGSIQRLEIVQNLHCVACVV